MRQDPNAVPYPRASYEQISYQEPTTQAPPAQWPQAQQAPPAYQAARHPDYPGDVQDDPAYSVYDPAYDAYDPAGVYDPAYDAYNWQDMAEPRPVAPEADAALAQVRAAQLKARRMQMVCVLLGVCAAAIFLVAAASHQLDGHIEVLTPVLLLSSAANFRRYAQRMATYRAAEADILTRVR